MKTRQYVSTAFRGLRVNTGRSILTILGIVIGITAIILVMAVGKGAEELILNQIRGLGAETIFVEPGREPEGPSNFAEVFTDSLTSRDLESLLNPINVRGIKEISPNVIQVVPVTFREETIRTNVLGAASSIETIMEITPEFGTFFNKDDVREKAAVAVLGAEVKKKLFGESEAMGSHIKIRSKTFRVVGVLPKKGQVAFFPVDDTVFIPYTTAQQYLLGIDYFHTMMIRAENETVVPRVVHDVILTLREQHGILDPDKDDFHVITQEDIVKRVGFITGILTILLVSVAGISLLVGGVGIMNIMLVSVTERTREIGLRKAVGATNRDILSQFLFEAVLLTSIGGMAGIFCGALFSFATVFILSRVVSGGWMFHFPLSATFIGLIVSTATGLVFGLYPARQASRKHPIEALRYE